jgi:hypothetical protein
MNEPRLTREFGNDAAASGPDNPWAVICDDETIASSTRCLAIWLSYDGDEPHHHARHLAWETFSILKQEHPADFDAITLDVWAGQRCVEGAVLPQVVVGFVGLTPELEAWLRDRMQEGDAFAGDSSTADPIELGLFPVARITAGGVKPRSMPVDFLMNCARRYRRVHDLMPWSRDPYTQVATGSPFPVEFAWMTSDGSIIDAEGGAIEIVLNAKLAPADVPDPEASTSAVIAQFAATFDGFEEYGDYQAALDTAQDVEARYRAGADLAAEMSLRELRTALFVEHLPSARPASVDPGYASTLMRAIRALVERESSRFQRLRRPSEAPKLGTTQRDAAGSSTALPRMSGTALEDFDEESQCLLAHEILLHAGPLEKSEAIRTLASELRDGGHVSYQRLHQDGPLYALLEEIIERAIKDFVIIDRPKRGWVRAILPDPNDYTRDRWRTCLLAVVTDEPMDRDQVVRLAAQWARERMGLAYERIREGGSIDKGLRSAMNSAIRRGEILRVGSQSIRRGQIADGAVAVSAE